MGAGARPARIVPAILATLIAFASPAAPEIEGLRPAAIRATPIGRFAPLGDRVGEARFLGGLWLTGAVHSLSGLAHVGPDRFVSVTDRGDWVTFDLARDGEGALAGATARIGPIALDRAAQGKRDADAEGVAVLPDGTLAVSFEHRGRVLRFAADGRPTGAVPILIPAHELRRNAGLEAIAAAPDGTVLAIAEHSVDQNGDAFAALIAGPETGLLRVRLHGWFDPTGAAFLPSGDLVLLERSFATLTWRMRVRRIARADIRPGAVLDGPVLMQAGLGAAIDNMEGIAAHRDTRGTVLTLVSDDNDLVVQRTLLLEFVLPEGAGVPPAMPLAMPPLPTPRARPSQAAAAASRPRSAP